MRFLKLLQNLNNTCFPDVRNFAGRNMSRLTYFD